MTRVKIKLSEEISIETYPFSEYITCIDIFRNGTLYNTFCSDNEVVNEWKEHPEILLHLGQDDTQKLNLSVAPRASTASLINNRQILGEGYEVELYTFSDYIVCFKVFHNNALATSFCFDKDTYDDMMNDAEELLSAIKQLPI